MEIPAVPKKMVFYSATGGFLGGVERFMFQAAGALRAAGIDCHGVFDAPGRDPGLFGEPFASVDFGAAALAGRCAGADWLWLHKCPDCSAPAALSGRLPVAVYVHDHDYYCFRRHKYFPFRRLNCSLPCGPYCLPCGLTASRPGRWRDFRRNLAFIRQADLVMAGSDYMLGNLLANGFPPDRLHKLSPLVDVKPQAPSPADNGEQDTAGANGANAATAPPGAEILYVGQLLRGKGVDLLLQAVARLTCPWRLTVIGDGSDAGFCRGLADRLGLADRVAFTGFVHDPGRFYRQATVLAFPSRWQEPFGMTGPEAMAHGVPVVAFDVGGVREWLTHDRNGLLVPDRDVDGFAQALGKLLTDRETAARLGRQSAADIAACTSANFTRRLTAILANCECAHR